MVSMKTIAQLLIETNIASPENIVGCTSNEVRQIEERFNIQFPSSYQDFLLTFGKNAGSFFRGTRIFYPELLTVHEDAEDLLQEVHSCFQIPENSFVFSIHQGYIFHYFLLTSDDPPVFEYRELAPDSIRVADSFTDWILQRINAHLHSQNLINSLST